jgi:hypothetical protein
LNSQFARQPDWNWYALTGIQYSYDLGNQRGDTLEAGLVGYYAKQDKLSQLDLGVAEAQIGPRVPIPEIVPGGSMRVYGIGTFALLAERSFFSGYGGGVSARFPVGAFLRTEPSVEYRRRDFYDSVFYPTASQLTGNLVTAAVGLDGLFGWLRWSSRIAFDHNSVNDFDFNSYDRWSADLALPFEWSFTWAGAKHAFLFVPSIGGSKTKYAEPNPVVDPDIARSDREWHVGAVAEVQVWKNFGIRTQVQYSETTSSLPNFETKNFQVSFGPTGRF